MDRTDTFYAATASIHGYGAQLQKGDGASPTETFQAVAGLRRFTYGAMQTADLDNTHLRSPAAHREHKPGLRDSAAMTGELLWLPTDESQSNTGGGSGSFTQGGLIKDWENRTTHNWRIVLYADGSPSITLPFTGYVSQFQPGEISGDTIVPATIAIQPTESYSQDMP